MQNSLGGKIKKELCRCLGLVHRVASLELADTYLHFCVPNSSLSIQF